MKIPGFNLNNKIYESEDLVLVKALETTKSSRPVILKITPLSSKEKIQSLKFEYKIGSQINSEKIVRTYDLGKYENFQFLVLEDFGGISLSDYIKNSTSLSILELLEISIEIAKCLEEIIINKVIHKDIKPSNILYNKITRVVKITDFGISIFTDTENISFCSPNSLQGTLSYMSPEQTGRMNKIVDYRTDFYSLGITLYELFTRTVPFEGANPLEVIHKHLANKATDPHLIAKEIPLSLSKVIMKLIEKNPEDRYQSAYGLISDLEFIYNEYKENNLFQKDFLPGINDRILKFQITQKLYGREKEINELISSFNKLEEGTPVLHLISGISGIGKTALVQEIFKPLTFKKGYYIYGKFDQLKQNIPYSAFLSAFRELAKQLLSEESESFKLWKDAILSKVGENVKILTDQIKELEIILGELPELSELNAQETENRYNLVLQDFFSVFSNKTHPLVLFLDDLQWADSASLKLLNLIIDKVLNSANEEDISLFLICAFRNNEINPSHPFQILIDNLERKNQLSQSRKIFVNYIHIDRLGFNDIINLIKDNLHSDENDIKELGEIISNKTNGNPFFINEILKNLYNNKLIYIDKKSNGISMRWDIEKIRSMSISDNVVEFLSSKMYQLSPNSRKVLTLSSCIGNTFDIVTLSAINNKSINDTSNELWDLINQGYILPIDKNYKFLGVEATPDKPHEIKYKFLHDRIQQAAYSLIDSDEKDSLHYKIGLHLYQEYLVSNENSDIFAIANHINTGKKLIELDEEKIQFSKFNLEVGMHAFKSTAYLAALNYFEVGLQLNQSDWINHYDLTLSLYTGAAESSYMARNSELMSIYSQEIIENTIKPYDRVKIYEVLVNHYMVIGTPEKSVQFALICLKELGLVFPKEPNLSHILINLVKTKLIIGTRSIDDLINLPTMRDQTSLYMMKIMDVMMSPSYMVAPDLFPLLVLKMVELTLRKGLTKESAYAFSCYAMVHCGILYDINKGNEVGLLSLKIREKLNLPEIECKIKLMYFFSVYFWKNNLIKSIEPVRQIYPLGLQYGDFEFVGHCLVVISYHSIYIGIDINELIGEMIKFKNICNTIRNIMSKDRISIYLQTLENLKTQILEPWILNGAYCEENEVINNFLNGKDRTSIFIFYHKKLFLALLFRNLKSAEIYSEQCANYAENAISLSMIPEYHFIDCLFYTSKYTEASFLERRLIRIKLEIKYRLFKRWVKFSSDNYKHKLLLIQAEIYKIKGNYPRAIQLYDHALLNAQSQGILPDIAIIQEFYGRFFYYIENITLGKELIKNACLSYDFWGAYSKSIHLKNEFNVFSNSNLESNNFKRNSSIEKSLPATTLGKEKLLSNSFLETIQGSNSFLDLSTILKSTQAISSEILLGNLLEKMITIAIENAGAQRGVLLLEKEENFYIEADGKVDGTKEILQSISMDNEKLPITILNYVIRTTQSIVIADGLKDNRFNKDIFITKNQVRSILCMPIIGQGKINGILYLENNLVTNAFTTDRLELLKVLASQASISIENARLYNSLEQKVEERTKELNVALAVVHDQKIQVESTLEELKETQEQLIHAEKFAALGQLVAGVAHEINNPIGAIQASAERIEDELEFGKREFPEYFRNLQEHEIPIFNELLDRSLSNKVILTTKEERNRKKIIKQSLESLEFSSSDKRSLALEYLSNLGITDRLDNYFTVLKEDKFLRTINIVDRFVSQSKSLRNIYISVEKASKVIFALRKFLNTNIKTEKKTISIREELEKVIKVYDNYINGFIEVSFEIREEINLTCLADEMSQVWRNIIFNSIQAMYSTEKNLKITLECENDSENPEKKIAIVKISDTGMGMTQEIKGKVYTPFFTTKPAGEGIGLGLFISRRIIEEHGGEITFTSEVGNTEFMVRIPI